MSNAGYKVGRGPIVEKKVGKGETKNNGCRDEVYSVKVSEMKHNMKNHRYSTTAQNDQNSPQKVKEHYD